MTTSSDAPSSPGQGRRAWIRGGGGRVTSHPSGPRGAGAGLRFPIYSATKTFVAAATLRLVESGSLTLDGPLSTWLPDAPAADLIALRHLLQHTSGLPDYGGMPAYHAAVRGGARPWSLGEFMRRAGAHSLRSEPGEDWAYSNLGYALVRSVLETVTGATLRDVLRREVVEPLRLQEIDVVRTAGDLDGLVMGPSEYLGDGEESVDVADRYDPRWVPAGLLGATVEALARFLHGLFSGHLLGKKLLREMIRLRPLKRVPGRPFVQPAYGLGLMGDRGGPYGRMLGHTGEGPGGSVAMYHFVDVEPPLTVTVASVREDVSTTEVALLRTAEALIHG